MIKFCKLPMGLANFKLTNISMASLHHFSASIRLWGMQMTWVKCLAQIVWFCCIYFTNNFKTWSYLALLVEAVLDLAAIVQRMDSKEFSEYILWQMVIYILDISVQHLNYWRQASITLRASSLPPIASISSKKIMHAFFVLAISNNSRTILAPYAKDK